MRKIVLIIVALLLVQFTFSQDKKWSLTGYVSNMESVMFMEIDEIKLDEHYNNLIHNRLNFNWYAKDWLTVNLEVRNRLQWWSLSDIMPIEYGSSMADDPGCFDVSENLLSGKSYALNTMLDRAYLEFNKDKWNIIVGRQRINWGQNFVWNPNDIFNSYSFFDFDYAERPGADALRIQYYTSMSSSVEVAMKANHNDDITAAGLYRFNKWNYDFQLLAGMLNSTDWVTGFGYTGSIKDAGFSGELTYFKPMEGEDESQEMIVAGIGGNYTFQNSLMLQMEILYSQNAGQGFGLLEYYNQELSAKTLAFTEYSIMGQASYTFTPLLSGTLAAMYYPEEDGYYIGPSIDYSLSNNLSLSLFGQYFDVPMGEFDTKMTTVYLRIKGNF